MSNSSSFLEQSKTAWTFIQEAQASDLPLKQECLSYLLERFQPAIKATLYKSGLHQHEQIEDLAQEFCRQFIEKDHLSKLDRSKGRFRAFLSTAVRNFLFDYFRKEQKNPKEISFHQTEDKVSSDLVNFESQENEVMHSYHKEWAKTIMKKALDAFFEHCEKENLSHYREVFERHILSPEKYHHPKQKDSAEALGKSAKDIENICRRSQLLFRNKVHAMVRETVQYESQVEEELKELKKYFGANS